MAQPLIPITWRNVTGPSNASANALLSKSGEQLGNALSGLGNTVDDYAADRQKRETDAFVAELNALGSDEERQDLLGRAEKGWLDMGQANTAVTERRAQDFLIADEGRAQEQEIRAQEQALMSQEAHDSTMATNEQQRTQIDTRAAREVLNNAYTDTQRAQKQKTYTDQEPIRAEKLRVAKENIENNKRVKQAKKDLAVSTGNIDTDRTRLNEMRAILRAQGVSEAQITEATSRSQKHVLKNFAKSIDADAEMMNILGLPDIINEKTNKSVAATTKDVGIDDYTAQLDKDLNDALTSKVMEAIPGLTDIEVAEQVAKIRSKSIGSNKKFNVIRKVQKTALDVAAKTQTAMAEQAVATIQSETVANKEQALFMADAKLKGVVDSINPILTEHYNKKGGEIPSNVLDNAVRRLDDILQSRTSTQQFDKGKRAVIILDFLQNNSEVGKWGEHDIIIDLNEDGQINDSFMGTSQDEEIGDVQVSQEDKVFRMMMEKSGSKKYKSVVKEFMDPVNALTVKSNNEEIKTLKNRIKNMGTFQGVGLNLLNSNSSVKNTEARIKKLEAENKKIEDQKIADKKEQ